MLFTVARRQCFANTVVFCSFVVKLKKVTMCVSVSFCVCFCNAKKKPATIVQTVMSNVVTGKQCKPLLFFQECNERFFACKRLLIL